MDSNLHIRIHFEALDKVTKPLEEVAASLAATSKAFNATQAKLDALNQPVPKEGRLEKVRQSASAMKDVGEGAQTLGMAMGAPLLVAAKEAMSFQSAMDDLNQAAGLAAPEAFAAMSDGLLDLAARVPVADEVLAKMATSAAQAGIARAELLKFTEDAAQLSIALRVPAEAAGEAMTQWRTVFNLGQAEAVRLGDQINALTNQYGGNAEVLTSMMNRVDGLGSLAGKVAPQMAAIAQIMSDQGVAADAGGAAIENMMLALSRGSSATKAQKGAFQSLGLDAEKVAEGMKSDPSAAIQQVMERLSALAPEKQSEIIAQLFGKDSAKAVTPLLNNLSQLKNNLEMVDQAGAFTGSTTKEYEDHLRSADGAISQARGAFSALAAEVGLQLLPTITAFAQGATTVIQWLRALVRENPELVKGMAHAAAVIGAMLAGVGGLAVKIAAIMPALTTLSPVVRFMAQKIFPMFGRAIGSMAMAIGRAGLMLMANPVVLAITLLVAAVAGAAYLIWKHWDAIVGAFIRAGAYLSGLWSQITTAATGALAQAGAFLSELWNQITTAATEALAQAGAYLSGLWSQITAAFTGALAGLSALWTKFREFGANLIQGLIDGVLSKLAALKETLLGAANGARDWFKNALGINSPSRVFAELGSETMAGLNQGLDAGASGPLQRVASLAQRMSDAMAVGTAAVGLTATPALAGGGPLTSVAAPSVSYNITINTPVGGNGQDIALAVRAEIERLERERAARARSSYRDTL